MWIKTKYKKVKSIEKKLDETIDVYLENDEPLNANLYLTVHILV